MDKFMYWVKKELIFHLSFDYNTPNVRIGWIWIIIAFFFFGYFSYLLCGLVTVCAVYNIVNRRRW